MQQPLQPYLVESLIKAEDASAKYYYAAFKSFGGLLQVLGSLFSGWLADRFGTKAVLLLSFGSSAASYALAAGATDVRMLFLSLLPTVFQHAILGARAYVFIVADDETRPARLSYISVMYGLGYVVGPTLGGQLGKVSLQLAASAAAVGSVLSLLSIAAVDLGAGSSASKKAASTASPASATSPPASTLLQDYATIWASPSVGRGTEGGQAGGLGLPPRTLPRSCAASSRPSSSSPSPGRSSRR